VIRIHRGAAPPELEPIRKRELARVREQRRRGEAMKLGKLYNAKGVRLALFQAQSAKCCYCEKQIRRKGNVVEHFRPKGRALRGPGFPKHGYWWLTWTWTNLLFACHGCNVTKGDRFPLAPGSRVLRQGSQPPGGEKARLIDPAAVDPMSEIRFIRLGGHWRPIPRNDSPPGKHTIRVMGLDAPDLLDFYDHHVKERVNPRIKAIQRKMAAQDLAGVQRSWARMLRVLFGPRAEFKALSYDVLEQAFSPATLAPFGLALSCP
jgi:uncharacterized protein (TIGR02646 family)